MTLPPRLRDLDPSEEHLRVAWHDPGIIEVVLSQPERRNAMSGPMTGAWETAMAEISRLPEVAVVVVRGEGKAFCAGGDLGWIAGDGQASVTDLMAKMQTFYRQWLSVMDVPVPTVAAINGPAVGAGAAIALACDLRVAAPEASFSVPFTRLGLHPGMGTTHLLPRVVGPAMAADLLLTGRRLSAPQMLEAGIVTQVLEGDFQAAALEQAAQIAGTAPIAARLTKQALRSAPGTLADALTWEGLAQPVTMTTEDMAEGLAAAVERRAPVFRGR